MPLEIEKPKTWKGLSYPLKSSLLLNALAGREEEMNIHLVYWTPRGVTPHSKAETYSLIDAEYWLPNDHVPYSRFYIRAGAIISSERKNAELLLENTILPKLADWMLAKISGDPKAASNAGRFTAYYVNGEAVIH